MLNLLEIPGSGCLHNSMLLHMDWLLQELLINNLMAQFYQPHRNVNIKESKKKKKEEEERGKEIKINSDLNSLSFS